MFNRVLISLALFAFVVLSAAAVWMGGLNQDEGWYLYAANLVAEGKMLYRDFFYTQGPGLPSIYRSFTWVWRFWGLLGARVFTLILGLIGIGLATGLARHLAPAGRKGEAALITFLLLGCNLYHLYYVAIPKTYALASVWVMTGFLLLSLGRKPLVMLCAGLALAYAAGTRISLGVLLGTVGLWLLCSRQKRALLWFCIGSFVGLAIVYGPFFCDAEARAGLWSAQQYHAARGGFDLVWAVGSLSRLVRWYLPVFIVLGLGALVPGARCLVPGASKEVFRPSTKLQAPSTCILLWGFLAVFAVQMLAPFPYEDYQVPIMGLLAVYAAVSFVSHNQIIEQSKQSKNLGLLLVLGLCFANSFGSPLLEKWMTNGQDRFWSLKKEKTELAYLREAARRIEALDPNGTGLFTQDLYLAIETNRKVPKGLEMGPFSVLSDDAWRALILSAPCHLAAISGYTFAIEPPSCRERPVAQQLEYLELLRQNYTARDRMPDFGQNATPLLLLERNRK